jgi:hypothetical protein
METFVIRLWTPSELDDAPYLRRLCGLVEDVRLGESCTFADGQQLLGLLQTRLDGRLADAMHDTRSAP